MSEENNKALFVGFNKINGSHPNKTKLGNYLGLPYQIIDISFDTEESLKQWNEEFAPTYRFTPVIYNPNNGHIHTLWKDPSVMYKQSGKDIELQNGMIADVHFVRKEYGEDKNGNKYHSYMKTPITVEGARESGKKADQDRCLIVEGETYTGDEILQKLNEMILQSFPLLPGELCPPRREPPQEEINKSITAPRTIEGGDSALTYLLKQGEYVQDPVNKSRLNKVGSDNKGQVWVISEHCLFFHDSRINDGHTCDIFNLIEFYEGKDRAREEMKKAFQKPWWTMNRNGNRDFILEKFLECWEYIFCHDEYKMLYQWNGMCWEKLGFDINSNDFDRLIYRYLWDMDTKLVSFDKKITKAIESFTMPHEPIKKKPEEVHFLNGCFNVLTEDFTPWTVETAPLKTLKMKYDEDLHDDSIMSEWFFNNWCGQDPETLQAIRQMFGACLTDHNVRKFWQIISEGGIGKNTIQNLWINACGKDLATVYDISQLTNPFIMLPKDGCLTMFINEPRIDELKPKPTSVLRELVSGDQIFENVKNQSDPRPFHNPQMVVVIFGNQTVDLSNDSEDEKQATLDREIILSLNEALKQTGMSGGDFSTDEKNQRSIIAFAMNGMKELIQNGYQAQGNDLSKNIELSRRANRNPVHDFLNETHPETFVANEKTNKGNFQYIFERWLEEPSNKDRYTEAQKERAISKFDRISMNYLRKHGITWNSRHFVKSK